jgi:hypothetical protein
MICKRNLGILVALLVALTGCTLFTPPPIDPPAKIPIKALLLDRTAFSPTWEQAWVDADSPYAEEALETFGTQFTHPMPYPNIATFYIARFRSPDEAHATWEAVVQSDEQPSWTPHRRPLPSANLKADQQVMLCRDHAPPPEGPNPNSSFCTVHLRYGSYVVQFTTYIDNRSLLTVEFSWILEVIDRKMAQIPKD